MNAGRMTRELHGEVERLLGHQAGVITRAQALAAGMTRDAIYARLRTERWQRIHAGGYAAYSAPVTRESLMRAAVLGARHGRVLCHQTAAELHGLLDARKGAALPDMVPRVHAAAPMERVALHHSKPLG